MKKSIFKLKFIVLFISTMFFIACENQKPKEIDPGFINYVASFTSGLVSNNETIIIRLTEEKQGVTLNQKIKEKLFTFSPNIEGTSTWIDNRTIEFKPEKPLKSAQLYDVSFDLSKILDVPEKFKLFEFQIQTIKQAIFVESEGTETYSSTDLTWQRCFGKIVTADYAKSDKIEEILKATQNGKKLKISWLHNDLEKTHRFFVDSVYRSKKASEVYLEWDADVIDVDQSGEKTIEVPAIDDFKVININVEYQPKQCVNIYFSDPLNPNQDLNGLIHFSNNNDVTFVIEKNIVKMFPTENLTSSSTIIVETGVKNVMNFPLKARFTQLVEFESLKPSVQLIGDGIIIPTTKGILFPFKSVNLKAVNVKIIKIFEDNVAQFFQVNQFDGSRELKRVGRIVYNKEVVLKSEKAIDYGKWNTFSLELSKLIEVEPGAIYRVSISFKKSQSMYPCNSDEEEEYEEIDDSEKELSKFDSPSNYYYDDYYESYDYYYEEYKWENRENPCKKEYYLNQNNIIARNVFASNLGIIAKSGDDNSITVAVTDLRTTEYLSNVNIEIYNYQNQLISKGTTNVEGMLRIPLQNKPFFLVAKKENQRGYLKLDDGSALSLSMFDVGGQKNTKGLKGFIYGERGVWRPGDSLYISFILEDKNNVIPKNHPVVFELYNPQNQLYLKKIKTSSINGFYDFRTATSSDAPTGNWIAKVKVGGAYFTKTIKIETVKPNRLKINLDFGTQIIKSTNEIKGKLNVKWLHGAIARNLKSDVSLIITKAKTSFEKFADYVFDDPAKSFFADQTIIFEGRLDENGQAVVKSNMNIDAKAPGMLNANFKIRAFEEGGDFSVDNMQLKYSPFKTYVGVKIPKGNGWNESLYSNEPNLIPIVCVDENGNLINRKNLKIEVYEVRWRWWWEDDNDGDDMSDLFNSESTSKILTDYVNTQNGKALYEMNLKTESWGRKLIRITDPISGHSCGAAFYTSYKGWWNGNGSNLPGGAEMLTFTTNKKEYKVGEKVKITLPVTKKGKALISLESGSKVLRTFWASVDNLNNSVEFIATKEMTPTIYANVTYIQPHSQTDNNLPIRMYGIQAINVIDVETKLEPIITMPKILKPESQVSIRIKEAKGKKMTYTIAIVDDGLLDLTRFKTPDAWKCFYEREALGIKTWDMYKYVLGAYSGEMAGILAIGGDENLLNKGGSKANRFKPVVKFLGPFVLEKSGENRHTFKMPNYVGSVRTMVVAGYDGAYGLAEKTTPVKKSLMVVATMPRVVGPNEKLKLPITVFAMDPKVKTVELEVQTNNLITVSDTTKKIIHFKKEGDQIVNFDIKIARAVGVGKLKVIARSGKETSVYDVELDVRIANPVITKTIEAMIEPGKSWTSEYSKIGINGTNKATLEVSSIPPMNLNERIQYLIQYPHGCIEQTTSSVFPQIYLSSIVSLSKTEIDKIENNIKAGINRIKLFQLTNGGLSYWPGESGIACDWGTNYAGHFMIEAKAKGYQVPESFMKNWLKYQEKRANEWSENSFHNDYEGDESQQIQAYRLYTLALAGKPIIGAMNRLREVRTLTNVAKWQLIAAYYISGYKNLAIEMSTNLKTNVNVNNNYRYTYGSDERDVAIILEALITIQDKTNSKHLFDDVSKALNSNSWYSTQTTAYSLLAISKFIGKNVKGNMSFVYKLNNTTEIPVSTTKTISNNKLSFGNSVNSKIEIKNTSQKNLFVKINLEGLPLESAEIEKNNQLNMDITYTDLQGNVVSPKSLKQGSDVVVNVSIKHPGIRSDYENLALTQIFPSGWEIMNPRMQLEEISTTNNSNIPTYQDIRDDRVYTYFDLKRGEEKTFKILINAAYIGKFYLPSFICTAMYDKEINAVSSGKWVEIIK